MAKIGKQGRDDSIKQFSIQPPYTDLFPLYLYTEERYEGRLYTKLFTISCCHPFCCFAIPTFCYIFNDFYYLFMSSFSTQMQETEVKLFAAFYRSWTGRANL